MQEINHQITSINQELKKYSIKNKIQFLDINTVLAPAGVLKGEFTSDGVHLLGDSYQLWAKEVEKVLAVLKL